MSWKETKLKSVPLFSHLNLRMLNLFLFPRPKSSLFLFDFTQTAATSPFCTHFSRLCPNATLTVVCCKSAIFILPFVRQLIFLLFKSLINAFIIKRSVVSSCVCWFNYIVNMYSCLCFHVRTPVNSSQTKRFLTWYAFIRFINVG